jgi:hypothetical protein
MFTNIAGRMSEEKEVQGAYSKLMRDLHEKEIQEMAEKQAINESKDKLSTRDLRKYVYATIRDGVEPTFGKEEDVLIIKHRSGKKFAIKILGEVY